MFSAATTSDYLDVFNVHHGDNLQHILMAVFGISFLIFIGTMFVPKKFIGKTVIGVMIVTTVCLIGSPVLGTIDALSMGKENEQVAENMKHNVMAKYGQELDLKSLKLPEIKDRDKPNRYSIVFRSGQTDSNYVMGEYLISFDRQTNEPTLTDLEPVKVLTADEIVENAKK